MTNEEVLQKIEEEIHLRGFSRHTREEYMIRAKLLMCYADHPLEELSVQDLHAYLLYLLYVKKLSPATVNIPNQEMDLGLLYLPYQHLLILLWQRY